MALRDEKVLQALGDAATAVLPKEWRNRMRAQMRAHFKLRRSKQADVIVLSRAKSGRTWLRAMISRLYQRRHGLPDTELLEFDNFHRADAAVPKFSFVHGHGLDDALDADPNPPWMAGKKLVFLIRDPLDVAVSEFFASTRRTKAGKHDMHGIESEIEMFDFVTEGPMGLDAIITFMNAWQARVQALGDRALTVRYEDLRAAPEDGLRRLTEFLGANFTDEEIADAVAATSFEVLKQKERTNFYKSSRLAPTDPNDPDSYKVRRAKVGGYRDYFDDKQIARMEAYVERHLSPAFGYGAGSAAKTPEAETPESETPESLTTSCTDDAAEASSCVAIE